MKKLVVLLTLLFLAGLASAAPQVYKVAAVPLYANPFSPLDCIYVSNDSAATATYRWFDGEDGVWYSTGSVSTYNSTSSGFDYNCSVNLTHNGHSDWVNSSNEAHVSDSGLNPFPFYYLHDGTPAAGYWVNFGDLYANYPISRYRYNFTFAGDVRYNISDVAFSKGILFVGSNLDVNFANMTAHNYFSSPPYTVYPNETCIYGLTGSGDWALNASGSDNNNATSDLQAAVNSANIFSFYKTFSCTLPAGTRIQVKTSVQSVAGGQTSITVYGNRTGGGTETISTYTQSGVAWYTYNVTYTLTQAINGLYVVIGDNAVAGAGNARVYEIRIIGKIPAAAENLTSPADFDSDGGYLYEVSHVEEESGLGFDFSDAGAADDSWLMVVSEAGTDYRNITDTDSVTWVVGTTQHTDHRYLETFITYDSGDNYYRRITPEYVCSSNLYVDRIMPVSDASTYPMSAYTFELEDSSPDNRYKDGWIKLKRNVPTHGILTIIDEKWPADNSVLAYLIDNREYSITLITDDCGTERNLGWVTANPASTTYTLALSSLYYNTTAYSTVFRYVQFYTTYDETTGRVNFTYIDSEDETDWVWWGVYYVSNDSLAYSDNSSTYTYHGSYLGDPAHDYYVNITFSHPGGSTLHFSTFIEKINEYLDALAYSGELGGFHANTFFMMASLGVITLTALIVTPAAAGVGGLMVFGEAALFSVIGWLPLLESAPGMLVLGLAGLLSLALAYRGNT